MLSQTNVHKNIVKSKENTCLAKGNSGVSESDEPDLVLRLTLPSHYPLHPPHIQAPVIPKWSPVLVLTRLEIA